PGHPQDRGGPRRHPPRADRRRQELQAYALAALLEDPVPGGAALDLRRHQARHDLRPHQHRGGRVPDQFRRARPADQRARRALRPRRDLRGDLLRDPGQRPVLHAHRADRAMAETGQLIQAPPRLPAPSRVTLLRIAIIVAVLVVWEAVAASGLLFRDLVPSLGVIARAVGRLLLESGLYGNLRVT